LNKEHSGSVGPREENTEEPCRKETETLGTVSTIEIISITPIFVSAALRNQSNLSYQSTQSTGTSGSMHTQSGNPRISMADEMRLPTFRGDGSEDPDQHWFLCESVWSIKNVTNEAVKQAQFSTTLRYNTLSWYMKLSKELRNLNR
jgi:hypothetical protein